MKFETKNVGDITRIVSATVCAIHHLDGWLLSSLISKIDRI